MSVFNLIKYLSSEIVTQGAMQILQFCYEIISFINRNIQQIHGLLSSVIKAFHYVFYILQPALLNAFFYGFLHLSLLSGFFLHYTRQNTYSFSPLVFPIASYYFGGSSLSASSLYTQEVYNCFKHLNTTWSECKRSACTFD